MRTFDYAPLYRSTVGFDRMLDLLDNSVRPDWPPYDIEKLSDDEYRISMAVVGFKQSEIEITQEGANLLVVGQKGGQADGRQLLHQGIASSSFKQAFSLADHVKVTNAGLEDGVLSITLVREIPEQLKPRKIEIGLNSSIGNQNPQKQIAQPSAGQPMAA